MFSYLSFHCALLLLLLLLLLLTRSLEGAYTVEVGQNASLPCSYTLSTPEKLVPVCWGKAPCPLMGCSSLVLSTDERKVNYQKSSRYWLTENFHKGNVSLTIVNVTLADSGTYCCRVQFPGPMNDAKFNLELVIKPAKVTSTPIVQKALTTGLPRMRPTQGHGTGTQTPGTFHDKNQTKILSILPKEVQGPGATTRMLFYIGTGISAGLALVLIFGALIVKWYSHRKNKLQDSRLITLANLPPSGLANAAAAGIRSEENIYTIEENAYEVEDLNEYYCGVGSGLPS